MTEPTRPVTFPHASRLLRLPLIPGHFHLLIRSGNGGLASFMRRLLTGYAINFNQRHKRVGHLFQNRYKSIVCEEEPYLLELVRYIHLNPLRARVVKSMAELDSYPWSGHAVILGKQQHEGLAAGEILNHFGKRKIVVWWVASRQVAVGMPVTRHPPHRSVRAALPHTAPASGQTQR